MNLVVIDRFHPRGEQGVQLQQGCRRGEVPFGQLLGAGVGDLDEELIPYGAEEPFDLAAALGPVRGGVHQLDAQLAAGAQQPRIDVGGSVVDIGGAGHATSREGRLERGGQADRVFGEPEPVTGHHPGMIVQEREQVGLAATNPWAVQRVADPPLVGGVGLEPAVHHCLAGGWADQLAAVEQPQQRRLRGRVAGGGAQDPGHLGGGPRRVLPLQRDRQLQHAGVDPGAGLADRGHQRVEPAGPIAADPPVQAVAGVGVLPAERAGVGAGGDGPHDPPPRLGRQLRVQRRTDHLVAEQRHLLGPLSTLDVVLFGCAHRCNTSIREGTSPAGTGRSATFARIPGPASAHQGQLVLHPAAGPAGGHPGASSRPPEQPAATCQAVTEPTTPTAPNRPVTAAVAAPNAASRSRHGQPSAVGTGWSTPARMATCSRYSRVLSKRAAATRSQPRTVSAGTPSFSPIRRCPAPPARATSAAPITSTAYPRRDSTVTGSSTWVTKQAGHRARRGRNQPGSPRTRRSRAHPHGRSAAGQSGHSTRPLPNRDSTRP